MRKSLKIILGILGIVIVYFAIDLLCIYIFNKPLIPLKKNPGDDVNIVYKGIIYDTYMCHDFEHPKIYMKNVKFVCSPKTKEEKISVASIMISENAVDTNISINDITISSELFNTYAEIFNSNAIQKELKKKHLKLHDIELELINNTSIIKTIYVCDDNEQECIDINNEYINLFKKNIVNLYNVSAVQVDSAVISTRVVEVMK